ncbi:MLH3 protein, partial [Amia calva]|nr:MLH3 protein [Amia calva]
MDRENMERVGNRYFTSKCGSLEDLDNLRFHGFRGEAIASIAGLATLVEISSRTHQSVQTFVKVFKDGKGLDVYEADLARPAAGTTVVICNFFHNLPVRRKRLDPVLECERIRQRIEGISLMHPSVSFSLRNDTTGTMVVQLSKTRNTYFRFTQIYGLGKAQKLGEITCSHNQFEMSGFIGREGHYNSSMQFLFVNKRLLLKTRIHKLLHFLLKKVSVANRQNGSPTVSTALGSPKQRSGSELQGVYVINIKCHYSEYDVCMEPAKTLIEFRDWDSVLFCVEEGVKKFLTRENLVAELSPEDVHEFVYENALNDQLACTDSTQGGTAIGDPKSVLDFPRQTPEWKTLTSKTVHRSLAIGFNVTESMCMASEEAEIVKGQEEKKNSDLESVYHALKEKTLAPSETKTDETTSSHVPSSHSSQIKASENRHSSAPDTVNAVSKNTVFYESFNDSDCIDVSNATTQLEDAAWRTSSDEDTVKPSANTNLGKECGHGRDPERSIESVASSHFSHFKTRSTFKAPKRKISLVGARGTASGGYSSYKDLVERVTRPGPKLSLSGTAESLDRFRRIYGKQNLSGKEPTPQDDNNNQNAPDAKTAQEVSVNPENHEINDSVGSAQLNDSPLTLSEFTRMKPMSAQSSSKAKGSLATKLSKLKGYQRENGCSISKEPPAGISCPVRLSRYEAPPAGETRVPCVTDITTMAVNVVSNRGFEYRCYPFHTEAVLPFLPRPRGERVSSGWDCAEDSGANESVWSLYAKWENPVFVRHPEVALDVSSGQADRLAVKIHNILYPYRFTKDMIHSMKASTCALVIQQVDKKFLACLIHTKDKEGANSTDSEEGNLLVLVDQHAAHERVRLENLIIDSYEAQPGQASGQKRLCSSSVSPPLEIDVTEEEFRMLRSCQPFLRDLGLEMTFAEDGGPRVLVGKVPVCFLEREANELRRGRQTVTKAIVEEYIREQIELLHSTGRVRGTLPLTVLKVLASQACHGAIKFNDSLSRKECCRLVESLSACQLPFQCAHGRPSMLPLADLDHLDTEPQDPPKPNLMKLRRMYRAWKLFGKP